MRPFVVADTEYTTWEGARERRWSGPGERREIIQIAAIKYDSEGRETERFMRYVKPVFNPMLSQLCIDLTGISQETVETEGVPFAQALREFVAFATGLDVWCYFRDDVILAENAAWHGEEFRMTVFLDARALVVLAGHDPAEWSSGRVHHLAGLPRPGAREHDALDDCMSLGVFVSSMLATGEAPASTSALRKESRRLQSELDDVGKQLETLKAAYDRERRRPISLSGSESGNNCSSRLNM